MTNIKNSLDLHLRILDILPRASIEIDNEGQLVIYTGLKEAEDSRCLEPFDVKE